VNSLSGHTTVKGERHSNSNRHLGEPMKRDLPWRTRLGTNINDRQRYAAKTIGGLIRAEETAD